MKQLLAISLFLLGCCCCICTQGQTKKIKPRHKSKQADSVVVLKSQAELFIPPKRNLLTTHVDLVLGAGRVASTDHSDLGFAGAVKGLYALTGALYINMGIGVTRINSIIRTDSTLYLGKNQATIAMLPIGVGFTIGDDRAQIINGIDFFPVYYVDHPTVKRERTFTYGIGVDIGFHIRIRQRLHLGMIGKLQMFQPFDKDEHQSFPRYGFIGAGLLLRYD